MQLEMWANAQRDGHWNHCSYFNEYFL